MQIPYTKKTLGNGLDVIVHEDHQLPMVAVNLWYHVGSKNERPGRTGFAHLFEHLMFEGSKHHDSGYFEPLQRAGGLLNGSTNTDRTNYWEVVPTGALELALFMESDRMGFLLPALTEDKFSNQRDVVLNERRQNYENRPYGLAGVALAAGAVSARSPVSLDHDRRPGRPSRGDAGRREGVLRDLLPPGQCVADTGGRHRDGAGAGAGRALLRRDSARPGAAAGDAGIPITAEQSLLLEDRVELPRLYLSWHSPAMFHAGDADLDLGADVLAHGKTSRLYKRLVYERRVAADVSAYQHSRELSGVFQVATHRRGRRVAAGAGGSHHRGAARDGGVGPHRRRTGAGRRPRPRRSSSTGCRRWAASAASPIS